MVLSAFKDILFRSRATYLNLSTSPCSWLKDWTIYIELRLSSMIPPSFLINENLCMAAFFVNLLINTIRAIIIGKNVKQTAANSGP
jgi:hypothetical protein